MVPDFGDELPLVEQAWFGTLEHKPGSDGHQAAVSATVERTLPDDPQFEPGKVEQADFTRTGANTFEDSSGECVRRQD